jgi:putative flippase GtrA
MKRVRSMMLDRHRHNWILLGKFSIVGGSGFFVNLGVFWICTLLAVDARQVVVDLPFTAYNIRAYHVYSTVAFLIANISNYLLNRAWTFGSRGHTAWQREYVPFLVIGVFAQVLALLVLTILLHAHSPIRVDNVLLAQAITIVVVMPVSFVGNKLWTFRAVRGLHRAQSGTT